MSRYQASDLCRAADRNDVGAIQSLLADPGFKRESLSISLSGSGTPLYCAASSGSYDAMKVLLDAGSDPNQGSFPGDVVNTPLNAVATGDGNGGGCYECARLLLQRGADPNLGLSKWSPGYRVGVPLETAAERLNARMMRILVEGGAKMPKGWKWRQVPYAQPYQLKAQGFPNTEQGRNDLLALVGEYARGNVPALPDPLDQLHKAHDAALKELKAAQADPNLTTGVPPVRHSAESRLNEAKRNLADIENQFPPGALAVRELTRPAPAAAAFGGKSRKRRGRGKRKTQRRKAKRLSSYAA